MAAKHPRCVKRVHCLDFGLGKTIWHPDDATKRAGRRGGAKTDRIEDVSGSRWQVRCGLVRVWSILRRSRRAWSIYIGTSKSGYKS